MRNILLLILISISISTSATDYYVSTSSPGSDSNNGTSPSTPWQTISKVNSAFTTFNPGDRILLRSGDTFYGTINMIKSGSAGLPITVGSYGSAGMPVISGFTALSSWTNTGNGIYSVSLACESSPEMVTINGLQYAMGRWPNIPGWPETQIWATIDSYVGVTSLTDAQLGTLGINWIGAEAVVRNSTRNRISIYPITNHTGNTLTFSDGNTSYPLGVGWGYFIQNDKRTLDKFGEWYYDTNTATFYMYFGSENPASYFVEVTTVNSLITLERGITYSQIENISLKGANNTAIYGLGYNHNSKIENCNISLCGHKGIYTFVTNNFNINNCTIKDCNDNAIKILDGCDNIYIGNNTLTKIGLFPGMGEGLWESGKAMFIRGNNNSIVEYNKVKNAGFSGIHYSGNNIIVRYNFVDSYGFIKEDCGGIQYANRGIYSNIKVLNNIIINGLGSPFGKPVENTHWVTGIYLDYFTTGGVEISGNTIANVKNMGGILVSGSQNVKIFNNTVFECTSGVRMQELEGLGSPPRNVEMKGNILFAKNSLNTPLLLYSLNNDFDQFGTFDNNHYARPLDNAKPIVLGISGSVSAKSLELWQSLYGLDPNSKISPIALTDTADIDFYYNATKSDKIITLVQPMLDVKGTSYVNSVTLTPFSSIILMVDPDPPVAVIPVYVSSVINNLTPTKLEITYTVKLNANSVPLTSDFIVKVNGAARTITAVEISGTKVILTLASPVIFGDNVTISYTQNPGKPLQTPSFGLAANLTDILVTNNLVDPSIPNDPPVVVVNYLEDVFSGFVYELDASGTTDANNDELTFKWTTPANMPVSAIDSSKIRFLTPVITNPQVITFGLTVTDGKLTTFKNISINNLPYKPELGLGKAKIIEASNYYLTDYPDNVDDGNLSTKWSINGDNQWLTISLTSPLKINHLQIALLPDQKYESFFDVYASKDNIIWEPVLQNAASCVFSGDLQNFNLPADKASNEYYFVKLLGHGNSQNTWNNYSEIRIFGSPGDNFKGVNDPGNISIYPNPVRDLINILVLEPSSDYLTLRIFDLAGKVRFETKIDPGVNNEQVPVVLSPGTYIVQVLSGKLIQFAQTLIIAK